MLTGICPGCGLRADLDVFCVQAAGGQYRIDRASAEIVDEDAPIG